ncbi:MAG: hypothetical protein ACRCRP_01775 [Metamycoplasmataceae bacterium]
MNTHKIYISHSDSQEGLILFEKVKMAVYELGKEVFHLGERTREISKIDQNWNKIYSNIVFCDTTIVILTKDLLKENKKDLLGGIMEQEIKASLFNNDMKDINGVILLLTDEFKKEYFNVEKNKNIHFPIIDNNIDNINSCRKSDTDYPGFLYAVDIKNFFKNTTSYLKRSEKIRDRQRELKIYEIEWTI